MNEYDEKLILTLYNLRYIEMLSNDVCFDLFVLI